MSSKSRTQTLKNQLPHRLLAETKTLLPEGCTFSSSAGVARVVFNREAWAVCGRKRTGWNKPRQCLRAVSKGSVRSEKRAERQRRQIRTSEEWSGCNSREGTRVSLGSMGVLCYGVFFFFFGLGELFILPHDFPSATRGPLCICLRARGGWYVPAARKNWWRGFMVRRLSG
ncbi:hypothetical protein B0J18DRAFT_223732 [Chaetomium sp. MPI-SDFR-AT-0129]|nr:hypothetical protein B0J18DRAFT_223732 [Chaetomium sp. MPI-SDFR-AT-0129]